jgi:hypothetical protein
VGPARSSTSTWPELMVEVAPDDAVRALLADG